MKLNLKLLLLFYLFGMGFNYLKAQSVTASAGDQNKSTKIDLNWTLGEIIVESTSKDELVLTQGFQQPKIEVISLQEEDVPVNACMVYPNPTNDYVILELTKSIQVPVKFSLFNSEGIAVIKGELTESRNFVSLRSIPTGTYILKLNIYDNNSIMFKIIKTN